MDCLEFRRLCDTDARNGDPDFAAHAADCAACARYAARANKLDKLIYDAVRFDVPLSLGGRPALERVRRRWLGLAAGFALAATIAGTIWVGAPRPAEALPSDVVAHIRHEPEALEPGRTVLDPPAVQKLLGRDEARIRETIGDVLYVSICPFRGRRVPHLVIASDRGPVTVMLLADEPVNEPMTIAEPGFAGRILPAGRGSVAIVGYEPVDAALEARVVNAVDWAG